MLRITFLCRTGELFTHVIQPGSVNTIDLQSPAFITKIVVADDGQPLFERERGDAPEPMDVEEALTVLTDFVRDHKDAEEGYPDSAPESDPEKVKEA